MSWLDGMTAGKVSGEELAPSDRSPWMFSNVTHYWKFVK
jgi:hypothetical protein